MALLSLRKWSVKTHPEKTLVSETSFDLPTGAVLGVYGPNGSGKTSLLKSISGIRIEGRETSGECWIENATAIAEMTPLERVKLVLYLASDFATPFDLTVRELLEMGARVGVVSPDRDRVRQVIEALHLGDFLPRVISTLSDGEKQLVMFARGVIQRPKVLVLDESFSKLDLDHLLWIAKQTRRFAKEGMTFLIASHDLNFLSEVADELLFMRKSVVIAKGLVNDLFTPTTLAELYPNLALQVVRSPESGKLKILY